MSSPYKIKSTFTMYTIDCIFLFLSVGWPSLIFSCQLDLHLMFNLSIVSVIVLRSFKMIYVSFKVWISTLSAGPTGHNLNATYKNVASYNFQDEVGRLMLNVCQVKMSSKNLFSVKETTKNISKAMKECWCQILTKNRQKIFSMSWKIFWPRIDKEPSNIFQCHGRFFSQESTKNHQNIFSISWKIF